MDGLDIRYLFLILKCLDVIILHNAVLYLILFIKCQINQIQIKINHPSPCQWIFITILNFHLFDALQFMWYLNSNKWSKSLWFSREFLSTFRLVFLKLFTARMAPTHNYNCIQHEASAQITWIIYYLFLSRHVRV